MQTGKYSRWSIVISAIAGLALIAAGLILLHRDNARRAEASPEQSLLRTRHPSCLPMASTSLLMAMRTVRANDADSPGSHFAKCGPEAGAVEKRSL